jgi:glucose-1-phosphate cytidylyltransferase
MKVVILAGGVGSRLSEETTIKPKPLIEIGDQPILWHIMKIYAAHGFDDFVVCCGYKGYAVKEYFASYVLRTGDVSFDLATGAMEVRSRRSEPWRVTLVDTGLDTMTGGRIRRVRDYLGDETFCLTYGDGVANIDIAGLVEFHRSQQTLATLTAVQPEGRFGALMLGHDESRITSFREKPDGDGAWINGGFFVLEPQVIDYIDGDDTIWEREPLQRLAREGQLSAYRHLGFWHPMDTLRDRSHLEALWASDAPPWKVWA